MHTQRGSRWERGQERGELTGMTQTSKTGLLYYRLRQKKRKEDNRGRRVTITGIEFAISGTLWHKYGRGTHTP